MWDGEMRTMKNEKTISLCSRDKHEAKWTITKRNQGKKNKQEKNWCSKIFSMVKNDFKIRPP